MRAMFRGRTGGRATEEPLGADAYRGAPEALRWRTALEQGDWRTVAAEMAGLTEPVQRELVVHVLATHLPRVRTLDEWAATGSADALLVRGAQGITWAWEARGSGGASSVPEESWVVFFSRLREAEMDLRRAAALDPSDPVPWSNLVLSARGLQIPIDETWARYRRVQALAPFLLFAADEMLECTCAKWSGSHDLMFEFAVTTSDAAPPGHPVHRLVPLALVERFAACEESDEWRDLRDRTPAFQQWLYAAAAKSVDLPAFGESPYIDRQRLITRNAFAAAFAIFDHLDRLRWELERIRDEVTSTPWYLLGGMRYVRELRRLTGLG